MVMVVMSSRQKTYHEIVRDCAKMDDGIMRSTCTKAEVNGLYPISRRVPVFTASQCRELPIYSPVPSCLSSSTATSLP